MNPLAADLNKTIAAINPHVTEMLSDLGRNLYFPKGILTQSAEAKKLAHTYNATIGTAMEAGIAMNLPDVMKPLPTTSPNDALLYAPSDGLAELREAWRGKILADNPSLKGKSMSLPVVTSGLTHGLGLVADLFVDSGDTVLLPDKIWGNYRMTFELRRGAVFSQFSFYDGDGFNLNAFRAALKSACKTGGKVIVLLNFPNNPTGYTPTEAEGEAMAEALIEAAEGGTNVVALLDDAYFGLFYGEQPMRESLFVKLADRHPRLLAIKADAATKEVFVWGLRVGFLTYSVGADGNTAPLYEALAKKTAGCIRSMISNCCRLSQQIVLDALRSDDFFRQRADKVAIMETRALKVMDVLTDSRFEEAWSVYPFNSGYFMCLRIKEVDAEALRVHMLERYGIGTISIGSTDLRIAFSCLEVEQIPDLFEQLYRGWRDLARP